MKKKRKTPKPRKPSVLDSKNWISESSMRSANEEPQDSGEPCQPFDLSKATTERVAPQASIFPGKTEPLDVIVNITVCNRDGKWCACVTGLKAQYSVWTSLLDMEEVTGIDANTTPETFCKQVADITPSKGNIPAATHWYVLAAIQAHEEVHASHVLEDLLNLATRPTTQEYITKIESICVDDNDQTEADAKAEILASAEYKKAVADLTNDFHVAFILHCGEDHRLELTWAAEEKVLAPIRSTICAYAADENWGPCPACGN